MHRIFLPLLSLLAAVSLNAQQMDVPVTQFWNTLMQANPAMTGLNYKHAANLTYHRENYSFGSNNGLNASYAIRLDSINSGIGISYSGNIWTYGNSQAILAHYAYHFHIGTSILSAGVSAGVRTLKYGHEWIAPQTSNDPLLPEGSFAPQFQANAGIVYHWRSLNTGISVTKLNSPRLKYNNGNGTFQFVPNYIFFADYTFQLPANFQLRPQVQAITDRIKYRTTISLMAIYNRKIWAGINYSDNSYFGGMAGIDIREKFRIGLSYGQWKSAFSNTYNKSFEVVLAYLLK